MARVWQLLVRADGDTRAAQKELRAVQRSARNVGRNLTSLGKTLTLGVTAPILAMGAMGVRELGEIERANAQTAAALERVGAKARISTSDVQKLAGALQEKSGIDDQAIQSASNLLMTMGNMSVTTAKGVDAFKLATSSMVDYADQTGITVQVAGKQYAQAMAAASAGTLKLPRGMKLAGAEQEKLKKKLAATSDVGERQQLVLDALNKRFTGGAKLTNPERWSVAMDKLAGSAAKLVVLALPAFNAFVDAVGRATKWFDGLSPRAQKMIGIGAGLAAVLGPLALIAGQMAMAWASLLPVLAAVAAALGTSIAVVGAVAVGVGALVAALVYAYVKSETFRTVVNNAFASVAASAKRLLGEARRTIDTWIGWARSAWSRWGTDIIRVARNAWSAISPIIMGVLKIIRSHISTVLAILRGDWAGAWNGIKGILSGVWMVIRGIVSAGAKGVVAILSTAWNVAKAAVAAAWNTIKGLVSSGIGRVAAAVRKLPGAIASAASGVAGKALAIGQAIIDGIMSALRAGAGQIVAYVASLGDRALSAIKKKLHISSPSRRFAEEVGKPIADGVAVGVRAATPRVVESVRAMGSSAVKAGQQAIKRLEALRVNQSFASSLLGLNLAKSGSTGTVGGMQQQIALMRSQYAQLSKFLSANGKKLGKDARQQIMDQMTGLLQGIESTQAAIADLGKQAVEDAKAAAEEIRQGILAAGSALNDAFDLRKAQAELAAEIAGADPSAALRQIAGEQYQALKAYLDANSSALSEGERASVIRQMLDALRASKEGIAVSASPSPSSTIPTIPSFARGGITRGLSFAGEAGPEAVIPLGASARNRADRARVMQQAGLGGNVEIHVHANSGDPEAIARRVANILASSRTRMAGAL